VEKKRLVGVAIILLSLCFSSAVFSATITFKSGQEIKGEIVKETVNYLIIDSGYRKTTIYFKDNVINNIDGVAYGKYGRKLGAVADTFKSTQGFAAVFAGVVIATMVVLISLFVIKKMIKKSGKKGE